MSVCQVLDTSVHLQTCPKGSKTPFPSTQRDLCVGRGKLRVVCFLTVAVGAIAKNPAKSSLLPKRSLRVSCVQAGLGLSLGPSLKRTRRAVGRRVETRTPPSEAATKARQSTDVRRAGQLSITHQPLYEWLRGVLDPVSVRRPSDSCAPMG